MKSIGNDIVSLTSINKQRTHDPKFFTKFITPSEHALYQTSIVNSLPFEDFVWLLWSVKESAYKYQKRLSPGLLFSPGKIIIQNVNIPYRPLAVNLTNKLWEGCAVGDGLYSGKVQVSGHRLDFKSIIQTELIATVVSDEHADFTKINCGIQSLSDHQHQNQSSSVRWILLDKLTVFFVKDLTMEKSDAGYPIILEQGKALNILVSLAHHAKFTFYCFYAGEGSK